MSEQPFDHRPDPELGAALRAALEREDDQPAFIARVMARYDETLERATLPTWEVLASWSGRGIAAALVAAVIGGFLLGRGVTTTSIDAAMAPAEGPGLTALMTAAEPPDASVVFASLIEPR
jgi:hypothetical protein